MKTDDYDDSSQSGVITTSLDALSADFTGYLLLPSRSQSINVLYRAQRYGRYYLLKGLAPEYRENPIYREYLSKEYQIGVKFDHPYIVRVNSLEEDPEVGLCIVMEYVDGESLDKWLATKPSISARKRIFKQIMEAVSYFHDRQVCHLDLKPSNIMVTRDGLTAKVIDFGLSDNCTFAFKQQGGTRKYAAPEQLNGQPVDHRSDIYALGGILKLMFPHRYKRVVRSAQRTNPDRRPRSVAVMERKMRPWWVLWLVLGLLCVGLFCLWMRPDGKKFTVTLDSGQTVYARVQSHWHRTLALVCPVDNAQKGWSEQPDQPSGDMVIPAQVRLRLMPYRIVSIDTGAFSRCVDLRHVTLPEGLEKIGYRAFANSMISDTIVIPRSVKEFESEIFHDCSFLTTMIFKATNCHCHVTPGVPCSFFYACHDLKKIVVDDSVESLPDCAFQGASYAEEIVLPNTLRDIPYAFSCYDFALKGIKLPDSLRKIYHGAFYNSGLESIVIPDKTEMIEGFSFSYCYKLHTVDIGKGMRLMETCTFRDNHALRTMIVRCEEPPEMRKDALYNIPDAAVLYVPSGSEEKYRKHPEWGKFKEIKAIEFQ